MCESPAAKMMMALKFLMLLTITAPLHGLTLINSNPPPHGEVAKMARYIIHNSDWVSVATVSTIPNIKSYPFANIKSMSDGPLNNGTGIPYMYMSPMDITSVDVKKDSRCTLVATLAESNYCKQQNFDPQDPRCARLILSGHLIKVDETKHAAEYSFAKNALFSRHPAMKNWPAYHNWFIGKIDIELVIVLDYFGGIKYVSVEDYFKAQESFTIENFLFEDVKIVEVMV